MLQRRPGSYYRLSFYYSAILLASFCLRSELHAAETEHEIRYEISPYLWAASLSGTTTTEGEESPPVDSDYSFFSLDNLDGVASATFSVRKQQWGIHVDLLYVGFEDEFIDDSALETTVRLEGRVFEYAGTYKPASFATTEIVAGLRQQIIEVELETLSQNPSASREWIDPFIGLIYYYPFNDNLNVSLRGDVGGFGIQSDLAVNTEAMLRYQFEETFSFKFGYRYLKVKFEDTDFVYDLSLEGFLLGLGIRF